MTEQDKQCQNLTDKMERQCPTLPDTKMIPFGDKVNTQQKSLALNKAIPANYSIYAISYTHNSDSNGGNLLFGKIVHHIRLSPLALSGIAIFK